MATLTKQPVPVAGLASLVWTAASAGGDEAPTGDRVLLLVRNTDVSSHTLTITTPATFRGIAIADPTVQVAADEVAAVPMDQAAYRQSSTGRAALSLDVATGVEYAVVELPR